MVDKMSRLYDHISGKKEKSLLRRTDELLRKCFGQYYVKTLGQLKYHLRFDRCRIHPVRPGADVKLSELSWNYELPLERKKQPLVSVFLKRTDNPVERRARENIVRRQTYQNIETIWIDNAADIVTLWNAGLEEAKGELIWIPSDEICYDKDFLEQMLRGFQYPSVMLALDSPELPEYTDTFPICVSGTEFAHSKAAGRVILETGHMLFRNAGKVPCEFVSHMKDENILPEILLFLFIQRGGTVACVERHSSRIAVGESVELPQEQYVEQLKKSSRILKQLPGIAMMCYALKTGGGEIFPIYLCNELRKLGAAVTLLNCNLEERDEEIVSLVDKSVPIVNLRNTDCIGDVILRLDCEIIHSHHATVDYAIAQWCRKYPYLGKHIITLHGMYETIAKEDCTRTIAATWKECSRYIYIAEKNLDCFKARGLLEQSRFKKLPNGLPDIEVRPVSREQLRISADAFVFIIASRAIPGKGWKEAVSAIEEARAQTQRELHLVLLGDGPCKGEIEDNVPEYIHVMGTVSNVRDYLAMADSGLIPSYYKGESFPLILIECMMCGKPVIATAIGEIPEMLKNPDGEQAGILIGTDGEGVNVQEITRAMLTIATQPELYERLQGRTKAVAEKFLITTVAQKYMLVYNETRLR